MMFEAMIMEQVLFFAGLFACLAFAFVGLRTVGFSSERIGRGTAQVVHVLEKSPGVRRLLAFSRRHRKAVSWVGALLAICFAPFALMGVVVVVGSVAAIYAFGYLAQFVEESEDEKSLRLRGTNADGTVPADGFSSDVIGYDGEIVPRYSSDAYKPF